MSSKADLQKTVTSFGYTLNPFTSKETLVNLIRLHLKVSEQGTNVAGLNDVELRSKLIKYNIEAGPIINHTRAIYQRKLLEAIANENVEGADDENVTDDTVDNDDDDFKTPPVSDESVASRTRRSFFPKIE